MKTIKLHWFTAAEDLTYIFYMHLQPTFVQIFFIIVISGDKPRREKCDHIWMIQVVKNMNVVA